MEIAIDFEPHQAALIEDRRQLEVSQITSVVLAALIYADLFDYPLTLDELVRYQVGRAFSGSEIEKEVLESLLLGELVHQSAGYYFLAGREALVPLRRRREKDSAKLWPKALRYGQWIRHLPFVRMVAVTGALSVHNIGDLPDIDLLVVAQTGRVWLCRRALIICVRLARLLGDDLCPNYIIAAGNLKLDQRDFYTAHELAQMIPLSGLEVYKRMMRANDWAASYLPAALGTFPTGKQASRRMPLQRVLEPLLGHALFNRLESWELARLRAKLRPVLGKATEVVCSPTQCKGHTGFHRQSVLERFQERARELGVESFLPGELNSTTPPSGDSVRVS